MTTLTIKINERSKKGKAFLAFAKTFFDKGNDIEIVETESKTVDIEESPYNPEFVKMVLDSAKSKNNIEINPNDVWGSLGFK